VAATAAASRLTEAHRTAQARLGATTVRQMLAAWPLLQLDNLDGTFDRWLQVVVPLVGAQRRQSARLAANYIATFRTLELGAAAGALQPVLAEELEVEQLATSMLVTGPAMIRRALARQTPARKAIANAQRASAGAAMRHVLNGGRETIVGTVDADKKAVGWARATSGRPCAFCAMLASRGPVYESGTVHFDAHDHCSCSAEPVYRSDAAWPAGSRRYQKLWEDSTAGAAGPEAARNAFRAALQSQVSA
jgi:hypothetical protein